MQEITKENYKKFLNDFFGIIVAIPKKDLVYNADFYIYGSRVNNKIIFHDIAYNMEDGAINGFSVLNVNLKEEDTFKNFDTMNYYQFDNMTEFCFWYLKQQSLLPEDIYNELKEIGAIPMSDTQIKGLDDFIKQNSTFAELPEELIEKLHSREKRIQELCKKVEDNYNKIEDKESFISFDPFKPIKLSKEAFDKIEEINNTPLTEKEKQSIVEFKEKVNKFYGTMEDKEWIHEKCGTNTPPTSVPEHPSKGNKKKLFPETEEQKIAKITETCLKDLIRDELKEQVQKDKFKELNKINGESIYWDIYCEKETTPEMREKIENIYPEFKEQYAKSYLQYDGNEYKTVKDIPQGVKDKSNQKPVTGMEPPEYILNKEQLDELMNPGHKKRRNKYKEIIKLMEHIVEYGLQRDTLEKRKKEVGWASFQKPIQKMIDDLDKKYNDWLDEEC